MAELVDARDLKSRDSNIVWVRFPPAAQNNGNNLMTSNNTVEHIDEKEDHTPEKIGPEDLKEWQRKTTQRQQKEKARRKKDKENRDRIRES